MTEREKNELVRQLLRLNLSYETFRKVYLHRVSEAEGK